MLAIPAGFRLDCQRPGVFVLTREADSRRALITTLVAGGAEPSQAQVDYIASKAFRDVIPVAG